MTITTSTIGARVALLVYFVIITQPPTFLQHLADQQRASRLHRHSGHAGVAGQTMSVCSSRKSLGICGG